MENRLKYFDIAKGIGMLCIIVGHLVVEVENFVFSFHVPVFYLISGYFLTQRQSVREYAKAKGKQLLIPYSVTCLSIISGATIMDFLHNSSRESALNCFQTWLAASFFGSGARELTEPFYARPIGAIWFLLALFTGLLIVRFFIQYPRGYIGIFITAYVGYKTTDMVWLPFSIQAGMVAAFYIYLGYLARQHKIMEKEAHPAVLSGITGIWLTSILYAGGVYLVANYFRSGLLSLLGSLAGSYLVILAAKEADKRTKWIAAVLDYVGRNSLLILCCHAFDLYVCSWDWFWKFGNGLHLEANTVLWLLICLRILTYCIAVAAISKINLFFKRMGVSQKFISLKAKQASCREYSEAEAQSIYLDIAKGISILLIIWGHTALPGYLREIIFSFHIPIFFIIASFAIESYNVKKTFLRSARSLLFPYTAVCFVSAIIYAAANHGSTDRLTLFIYKIKTMILGMSFSSTILQDIDSVAVIWFVCCLFLSVNIYVLLMKMLEKCPSGICVLTILVFSAIGCLTGQQIAFLPWSLDVALAALPFIAFGDWIRKNKFMNANFFCTLVLPAAIWFYFLKTGINIELPTRSYPLGMISFIEAMAGSLVVLSLSAHMKKNTAAAKLLSWVGRNSMIVLGVHCIEMLYFNWDDWIFPHLPINKDWFPEFLLRSISILLITAIIDMTKRNISRLRH